MRSQAEIEDKIKQLSKGADPTKMQRKTLIHKLKWTNAYPHLDKKLRDDPETKLYWEKKCCLEKDYLIKELAEQVDYTYSLIADRDMVKIMVSVQIIFVQIWLLGPSRDHFLRIFMPEVQGMHRDAGRSAMKKLCEEFGFNHKLYVRRYLNETESGIILPPGGGIE